MVFNSGKDDALTVQVPLGDRSYDIEIRSGAFDEDNDSGSFCSKLMSTMGDLSHVVLIADDAIKETWLPKIVPQLKASVSRVSVLYVPSGESSKSPTELTKIWNWMLEVGADRRSVLIALGGGVVGDLAGFAAASFTRGIRFVQVPTTLLAMVDSSVGGKTGINLSGGKNMVGAFWQPELVWIDTSVLSTLPDRIFLSGLAEVVKYGVIDDPEFFTWLETNADDLVNRNDEALRYAISESCKSKARVVAEDERETSGRRAILNYGHTFAHAIEATAGYGTLLHGEAVSIGMQMAARLAIDIGICGEDLLDRQTELLQRCQLPIIFPECNPREMLPVMHRDKKVAHGKLRFILPRSIGKVDLVGDVDEAAVVKSIIATKA